MNFDGFIEKLKEDYERWCYEYRDNREFTECIDELVKEYKGSDNQNSAKGCGKQMGTYPTLDKYDIKKLNKVFNEVV